MSFWTRSRSTLALALALAACGGDGTSGNAPTGGTDDGGSGGRGGSGGGGSPGPDAAPQNDAGPGGTPAPDAGPPTEQSLIEGVPATAQFVIPGLSGPAHVLRTEGNVPHVYARSRDDLGRVIGFVLARDRYFFMELQRRLGLGKISELLGDRALSNDMASRLTGIAYVAQRLDENLSAETRAYLEAVVVGVNTYIDGVRAGELPAPSELMLAGPFLGATMPADLMQPWTVRDLMGMAAVPLFETNFRAEDVVRSQKKQALETAFDDVANSELRRTGFFADFWENNRPLFPGSPSAEDFGTSGMPKRGPRLAASLPQDLPVEAGMLRNLAERLGKWNNTLTHRPGGPYGSNAWAVGGDQTADGSSLVAGDGHLALSVPALMYQVGLDTRVFGGGEIHQRGMFLTPFPILGVGTNGNVAWSMVNPRLDITDFYREELQLGADGAPSASFFQGEWRPLEGIDEQYVIANVPALESVGRTETWKRYMTFDGRWLLDLEGRVLLTPAEAMPGETVVHFGDHLVVPGDADGDGVITGVSFDHGGFDAARWADALYQMGLAEDVMEYRAASRGLVGGGLFMAAGDSKGNVLYSSYQAVPCRSTLMRENGVFAEGSHPNFLLDGTVHGAFSMPTDAEGVIDESQGAADPSKCVIPFEAMPQAINPTSGFVFTANNEPTVIDDDGVHTNDTWYLGGPWESPRGDSIRQGLEAATADGAATIEEMAGIQADTKSRLGERLNPHFVGAWERAKAAVEAGAAASEAEQVLAGLYAERAEEIDRALGYLAPWDLSTGSGVETFYHQPAPGEAEHAVATMIFNVAALELEALVWGDETVRDLFPYQPFYARMSALLTMLEARFPGGETLAGADPETGESVFFDRTDTPALERADELVLRALIAAIDKLSAAPTPDTDGTEGGFGTSDMSQWLWGLRHQVRFESLLAGFLGDDPLLSTLTSRFNINTRTLPLAEGLAADDPRKKLSWFPRGGDHFSVDAADPELGRVNFHYTHGPVMRMVVSLKDGRVTGQNIIPGGQSGLADDPHFADQAALWLGNETWPIRFHVEEVVEGAVAHEVYAP